MRCIKHQRRPVQRVEAIAGALLIGTVLASAQDETNSPPIPSPPPKIPWETTASVGVTLTRGNSSTTVGTMTLDTKRKWNQNEVAFGAAGGYGTDKDVKNTEYFTAFGQYNRLFTERFYAGYRTSFNYDGIADLSYRITTGPLAGYYLVKSTNTTLTVEAGPSVVFQKYQGKGENTYYGFRLGQHFEHRLSATTKIWEDVSYVPDVERWSEKYTVTAEAGIDAAINKHWSLRVVFQDIYESEPANDRLKNDVRLIAGTAFKF